MVYQLKRRIQVDNFMNREALSLANDCSTSLPVEFSEFVETIEKSIKLNPRLLFKKVKTKMISPYDRTTLNQLKL